MVSRRGRASNSFNVLWLGAIFTALLLVFGGGYLYESPSLVSFTDQHWFATKQKIQRDWRYQDFRASEKVHVLQLSYPNGVDFWLDVKGKRRLADKLNKYDGPVVLNLDGMRLSLDKELKGILANPKVIRPFHTSKVGIPERNPLERDLEAIVGSRLEQKQEVLYSRLEEVFPKNSDYYSRGFSGAVGLYEHRKQSVHFISSYPLRNAASFLDLPTLLLPGVAMVHQCRDYYLKADNELELKDCRLPSGVSSMHLQLHDPLPLSFYRGGVKMADLESLPKSGLLVVEVVTPATSITTAMGEEGSSWGVLIATAFSNILKGHTPKTPGALRFIEAGAFLLGMILLYGAAKRLPIRNTIVAVLVILGAVLALDLAATVVGNFRTTPIEEVAGLLLLAFVAIGTRGVDDFRERLLIERAVAGYVSEERLKRLLSGQEELALKGERRELTTILLDIAGFSKITSRLEIDRVFIFVQKFFDVVDPIIFMVGGTIDKKTGDGLLAFFGDAEGVSPEEAARRAVEGGLKVQRALKELPPDYFGADLKVQVRVGINTGDMMIGNAGSTRHFNYTVLGDAVNLTQRYEAGCPVGSVLIGVRTAEYVAPHFELRKVEVEAKHHDQPLIAYEVIGPKIVPLPNRDIA